MLFVQWMSRHWRSDSCYGENGVDGGTCSFQRYLSEVEKWCPILPNSRYIQATAGTNVETTKLVSVLVVVAGVRGGVRLTWLHTGAHGCGNEC